MLVRPTASRFTAVLAAFASTTLVLSGCSNVMAPQAPAAAITVSGNWQIASTVPASAKLPSLSGELTGTNVSMRGIFHSNTPGACIRPASSFEVTGSADAQNNVTLIGTNVAGGTLSIHGALAADGKSITGARYNVVGGSCAFPQAATAAAVQYSSITGAYTGSFSDADGQLLTLQANLTQSPASDTDGNFQLSGTGTFPDNPCFSSPVTLSSSQVTGGTFNFTYADSNTGNSVNVIGSFSTDGRTLTVSQWNLTGSCGPDTGTGSLKQQ